MRDLRGGLGDAADLVQQGQRCLLAGDVQGSGLVAQDRAHGDVRLAQILAGALVTEGARLVADLHPPFGVEVLPDVDQREAAGADFHDPVGAAGPQRDAVGGERQHPEGPLGRLGGDQIAGEEGVREHHALGDGAGQRPDLVLTGGGEDHQAVLGVCQVDFRQGAVELCHDLGAPFPADAGVGFQPLPGLGHHIAQPDRILSALGFAAMCRRQHGHCRIRTRAPQFGKGCGTQCVLHDSTIGRFQLSGIRTQKRTFRYAASCPGRDASTRLDTKRLHAFDMSIIWTAIVLLAGSKLLRGNSGSHPTHGSPYGQPSPMTRQ